LQARARQNLLGGEFTPGFALELMHKDLRLALELGHAAGVPLPVAAAAFAQYQAALDQGCAELDFSAIAQVYERAAGIRLAQPPG